MHTNNGYFKYLFIKSIVYIDIRLFNSENMIIRTSYNSTLTVCQIT